MVTVSVTTFINNQRFGGKHMMNKLRRWAMIRVQGSLEEITGRGWMFVMVIIGIVMVFGPVVYGLMHTNVGSSLNTVSSGFNFAGLN